MKLKLNLSINTIKPKRKSAKGNKPVGVTISLNDLTISVRPKRWKDEDGKGIDWNNKRGELYTQKFFRLPFNYCVDTHKREKTYAEAVNTLLDIDWVLDEFDVSFNELAISSMKYHMDYAVTDCTPERRAKYENMIERLTRQAYPITDAELDALEGVNKVDLDTLNDDDFWEAITNPERTPEQAALVEDYSARKEQHNNAQWERIKAARIEFVSDILPGLWS